MMDTLTFTIYSNKFVPGEYVTKKEMEEHAHKNNYDLIYLDDRVRQKVSSKSCYRGNKGGTIYYTFIAVTGYDGIYQYLGELYEDAKVYIIRTFIDAKLMLHIKVNAKIHTTKYIIKFSLQIEADFTKGIDVIVETEGFEDYQYLSGCNVHVHYMKRRLFLKEKLYLKNIIDDVDYKMNRQRHRYKIQTKNNF